MSPETNKKSYRWVKGLLFIFLLGVCLEHIPGTYTIDDFQDDYELDSPEGIALLTLSGVSLDAELFFAEETRHRISRHAEILVPAGATLKASASMVPLVLDGEVVARPKTLLLTSDKPLTFIYRYVTVAKASRLTIDPEDPDAQVKAIGHYKILSALATSYRYKRQKELRRDYKIPTRARVNLDAKIHHDHQIQTAEGYTLFTGPTPGTLSVEDAAWEKTRWERGSLSLRLGFSDVNPLVSQIVSDLLPKEIELGKLFTLKVLRIFNLEFSKNFLSLYVNGTLTSANSDRVAAVFTPSFQSHLGIQFSFPEQSLLSEAKAAIELKNIYSLDFNRSNPMFDKYARDLVRKYREEVSETWDLSEEFPILMGLPGDFYIETFELTANDQGHPGLDVRIRVLPSRSAQGDIK